MQRIVNSLFNISNNIPETNNYSAPLFKPESEEEIMQILDRVEEFSKQVESWQRERQEAIAAEKEHFIEFIRKVTRTVDIDTKSRLLQEVIKIDQMKHYIRVLTN